MSEASVFISYNHEDEEWKDRLVSHLGVLERQGLLKTWHDRQIGAGEDWLGKIEAQERLPRTFMIACRP